MKLSIKQYIDETVRREAKIGYDKELKVWYGTLDHKVGLLCSQRKTKAEVKKELTEILEEFIILSLKEGKKDKHSEIYKIQGAYR